MRALFVDDHRDSVDSLAALASAMGHEVFKAYDGASALGLTHEMCFDLILLDICLGGEDGRDVCAAIRRDGLSRNSLIIAVTGHTGLEHNLNLGDFNGYVLKPIEFDRLEELLTA